MTAAPKSAATKPKAPPADRLRRRRTACPATREAWERMGAAQRAAVLAAVAAGGRYAVEHGVYQTRLRAVVRGVLPADAVERLTACGFRPLPRSLRVEARRVASPPTTRHPYGIVREQPVDVVTYGLDLDP